MKTDIEVVNFLASDRIYFNSFSNLSLTTVNKSLIFIVCDLKACTLSIFLPITLYKNNSVLLKFSITVLSNFVKSLILLIRFSN